MSETYRVLVVDDDEAIRTLISRFLTSSGCETRSASTAAEATALLAVFRPDIALVDYLLPDGNALDLLPTLLGLDPQLPVVILTGHGDIDLAVAATKAGAENFLTKPVQLAALKTILDRAIERRRLRRVEAASLRSSSRQEPDPFVGTSSAIGMLKHEAEIAASSDAPVLLLGETGSGKGVLARWIHSNSRRAREGFVDLNCAGLSKELVESELFGHARGAFTGAVQNKTGLVEYADRGSLFLDEIGDLDQAVQPKLLKVLEDHSYRRLGEVRERSADIRLIAATHVDLTEACANGRFRSDLFYRINTLTLSIPPLRARPGDIPALAERLLEQLALETGRTTTLSAGATEVLSNHSWPGNIRELRNSLERAVLHSRTPELDASVFGSISGEVVRRPEPAATGGQVAPADTPLLVGGERPELQEVERRYVELVLGEEDGSVARAAARLGVPRSTLYQRLKVLGLESKR